MENHLIRQKNDYIMPQGHLGILKDKIYQGAIELAKKLESLFSSSGSILPLSLRHFVYGIFYKRMVRKEMEVSCMSSEKKILQIGCGSYPFTAITMASEGIPVDAVECDPKAYNSAKEIIKQKGLEDKINLILSNGSNLDYSQYDIVHVSLHVHPKKDLLLQILHQLSDHGALLYRNPHKAITFAYTSVRPDDLAKDLSNYFIELVKGLPTCETIRMIQNETILGGSQDA